MSGGPFADLHLHTHCSDGSDAPARVVSRAAECGIAAMAITDHDTIAGLPEARTAAADAGIEFINGTEVSCHFEGREIHVLGFGFRDDGGPLDAPLAALCEARTTRATGIMERLQSAGIAIDSEAVRARAGNGAVSRMHIAKELHAMGVTPDVQAGFDRYLKKGRPAFVEKETMACAEAVDLIHAAGGVAMVAHPALGQGLGRMLEALLTLPFDGLEAYHTSHTPGETEALLQMAGERGLLVCGGSDCHGTMKGGEPEMGKVRLPLVHVARLREAVGVGT